jgi:cytochrome c-type biogenesis protein CcmH/NrfF
MPSFNLRPLAGTVRMMATGAGGVVALLMLLSTSAALAETKVSVAREASAIAHSLMSPFCPGMTLAACPSPNAATVRLEITDRLRRGDTRAAIVADLEARFGEAVASAPRATGVGLLFWVAPAFLGGALLLAIAAAYRGGVPEDVPADSGGDAASTAALTARLDDELGDLD